MRAVLDANVYVSALLRPEGPPGRVVALALDGAFQPVVSRAIVEEVRAVLAYPKIRKAMRSRVDPIAWFADVEFIADLVDDREGAPQVCADLDDDKYLWAAHEGLAAFVVSGDAALLAVREHEGVRVVAPAAFLRLLKSNP